MKFSLAMIAYVFALLAAGMATFGPPLGIVLSAIVISYWRWMRRCPRNLIDVLLITTVVGLLVALLFPRFDVGRENIRCARCFSHIREVALALRNYQIRYGRLPPVGLPGESNGQEVSWRTEVLRSLEEATLFESYRRDEPWDGATNAKVTTVPLAIFECPSDPPVVSGSPQTNYFALDEAKTVWAEGEMPGHFSDPPGQTIMLIEAAGTNVPWAKPHDLSFAEAMAILTGAAPSQVVHVRSPNPGFFYKGNARAQEGVHVAFANGRVGFVPLPISAELATALLTANGGEKLDSSVIDSLLLPQLDYGKIYAFAAFVGLALLPGVRLIRRARSGEACAA